MLFFSTLRQKLQNLLKITGRTYEEETHLPYMTDCHNEVPEAHNEDLMECQGIIQREVDRKNPKLEKFHETLSYESA